jgi:hypothetical protein
MGDAVVSSGPAPWDAALLPNLAWTQSADTLLVCHPAMAPVRLTRTSHVNWSLSLWPWSRPPTYRFAPDDVTLTPSGLSGAVTLAASSPVFQAMHAGTTLRFRGVRAGVTGVPDASTATVLLEGTLPNTAASADWEEAAFGQGRGWPATACFHQDRLVLGGSRDLPNRLWLSKSGALFDFDRGRGLDDEAIEFGLMSDQVNAIRGVFSGRHLQVFTTGGEWMVSGDPLTPSSIQLHRQTRIGSPSLRIVPPVDVDGSTIFSSRSGRAIHEIAYTDVAQAYQSNDLGLVASHLIRDPVSMAYDQVGRLLYVVMGDGSLATLTLFRAEQVTGWTRQETAGAFRAVAETEGRVFCVVERGATHRLERFDATLSLDAALDGTSAVPQDRWTGVAHLDGLSAGVLADGAPRADAAVSGGAVVIDPPAGAVQVGLRYAHEIEPLPPELMTAAGARSAPMRLVSASFRLLDTAALSVDLGREPKPVPFRRLDTALLDAGPPRFSGDVRLAAIGWRRDAMRPLWRIEGDAPLPMTLLSVTTDMRTTD